MSDTPVDLVIGFCTFRRPQGLTCLFRSLAALRPVPGARMRVVVVDNDAEPSSRALVEALARDLPWPCRYVHEPDPGIPQARNRVLAEAADADFLLFVDDDETVTPDLAREHLRIRRQTGATFVQGPCEKTVADSADAWWLETGFFRDRDFPDAAPRHESWTNNVLIDMAFVRESGVRFDPRLRYSGGEDTMFFQDIVRRGGRGAFAARAVVREEQQKSRLTWRWALKRQYSYGVTRANTLMLRQSRLSAVPRCLLRAAAMEVVGLGLMATALVRGRRGLADGSALMMRGAGVFLGAVGFGADEYARSTENASV